MCTRQCPPQHRQELCAAHGPNVAQLGTVSVVKHAHLRPERLLSQRLLVARLQSGGVGACAHAHVYCMHTCVLWCVHVYACMCVVRVCACTYSTYWYAVGDNTLYAHSQQCLHTLPTTQRLPSNLTCTTTTHLRMSCGAHQALAMRSEFRRRGF